MRLDVHARSSYERDKYQPGYRRPWTIVVAIAIATMAIYRIACPVCLHLPPVSPPVHGRPGPFWDCRHTLLRSSLLAVSLINDTFFCSSLNPTTTFWWGWLSCRRRHCQKVTLANIDRRTCSYFSQYTLSNSLPLDNNNTTAIMSIETVSTKPFQDQKPGT